MEKLEVRRLDLAKRVIGRKLQMRTSREITEPTPSPKSKDSLTVPLTKYAATALTVHIDGSAMVEC